MGPKPVCRLRHCFIVYIEIVYWLLLYRLKDRNMPLSREHFRQRLGGGLKGAFGASSII
jgi:hypothetical protein